MDKEKKKKMSTTARAVLVQSDAVEKIKAEVTCPLCLCIFVDPKKLPCEHVYCKKCIDNLIAKCFRAKLDCPECRMNIEIPDNKVQNFPSAFQVNRLLDAYTALERGMQDSGVHEADAKEESTKCRKHSTQSLALYCSTCDCLVCRDCILGGSEHKSHQYGYAPHYAKECRCDVTDVLEVADTALERTSNAIANITTTKTMLETHTEAMIDKVHASFSALFTVLESQEKAMTHKVKVLMEGKQNTVVSQIDELKSTHEKLKSKVAALRTFADNADPVKFLSDKEHMIEDVVEIMGRLEKMPLEPAEAADDGVQILAPDMLHTLTTKSSKTYKLADPAQCTAEGAGLKAAESHEEACFSVHLLNAKGEPCSGIQDVVVEVKSLRTEMVALAKIMNSIVTSNASVSYAVETRGRHEISVKVNGHHIRDSPFSVFISHHVSKFADPVSVITGLERPAGLACCLNTGWWIATEIDINMLKVYNNHSELVAKLDMAFPYGVAIDDDLNFYVTSAANGEIHKYSHDGDLLKVGAGFGQSPGNLWYPDGLAISSDNKLYVCDRNNNRIQIFDLELKFLQSFGSKGTRKGQFDHPTDIALDTADHVYITDQNNDRVQVFDKNGHFLHMFGRKGHAPGELNMPIGIAIQRDLVFVADSDNNRISVFTTMGNFVTSFGETHLHKPEGLAIDQDGFVYSTCCRKEIKIF